MMSQPKHCQPLMPAPKKALKPAPRVELLTVLGVADDRVAPLGETR